MLSDLKNPAFRSTCYWFIRDKMNKEKMMFLLPLYFLPVSCGDRSCHKVMSLNNTHIHAPRWIMVPAYGVHVAASSSPKDGFNITRVPHPFFLTLRTALFRNAAFFMDCFVNLDPNSVSNGLTSSATSILAHSLLEYNQQDPTIEQISQS